MDHNTNDGNYTSKSPRAVRPSTPGARSTYRRLRLGLLSTMLLALISGLSLGHGVAYAADGDLDPAFDGDGLDRITYRILYSFCTPQIRASPHMMVTRHLPLHYRPLI